MIRLRYPMGMKRGFLPIVFALGTAGLLCVSCVSGTRYRGMTEQALVPGAGASGLSDNYDRKILLAVGIDNYRNTDRLRHAVGDAKAIVALFRSAGFETHELYDDAATKSAIMDLVQSAARGAGSNDVVVFFFAGHGIDVKGDSGTKGYIVPVEGRIKDPGELVPMDWLQIDLVSDARVRAKHMLFLLDACSSGIVAARSSVSVDSSVRNYISELMKRQARQVITAGTGNQQVLDGGYQGHSIFAGWILQGLEGNLADLNNDYHITATELGLFLSERVYIQSQGAQKPDFAKLLGTQGGEVILRFPDEKERQILAERNRNAGPAETDLAITVRPVKADIQVYDMKNNLVAEEKGVTGRAVLRKLPAGDYQVIVRAVDSQYESVMMLLGLYGPVARDVVLPKRRISVTSVPLL